MPGVQLSRWSKHKPNEALRVQSGGKGSSPGVVVVGIWQVKMVGLQSKVTQDGEKMQTGVRPMYVEEKVGK